MEVGAAVAGDLEPPAPPGPTMKTLGQIPPTWSQSLDSTDGEPDGCNSSRFKCVLGGVAVLDMETGLVWERNPFNDYTNWPTSIDACLQKTVGNRGGWRLPRAEEIFSLIDRSSGLPRLPASHPFTGLQGSTVYYSTTLVATDESKAWGLSVDLMQNQVSPGQAPISGPGYTSYWCVRGGQGDAVH
jgi:hypothetical protein